MLGATTASSHKKLQTSVARLHWAARKRLVAMETTVQSVEAIHQFAASAASIPTLVLEKMKHVTLRAVRQSILRPLNVAIT